MRALEEKILKDGVILGNDILVVGRFLNQNIDVSLLKEMVRDVKKHFDTHIDRVLTVEASGIPFATAVALEYGCDMIFAKKSLSSNLSGNIIKTTVKSYTRNKIFDLSINKDYVNRGERVLIVDDFLAEGNAAMALLDLAKQAELEVVGFSFCVEKEFQNGGKKIRDLGYDCYSLASIKKMNKDEIIFNK